MKEKRILNVKQSSSDILDTFAIFEYGEANVSHELPQQLLPVSAILVTSVILPSLSFLAHSKSVGAFRI